MGLNSNNYVGTSLDWTPFTNSKDLPVGKQIAFKCEDGKIMYGTVFEISNGTMLLVDGRFDFDMMDYLKTSQWTVIDFIFEEE